MDVTIAICTYNHSESLRKTLRALERVRVPEGLRCELLIVNNASTDRTEEVARSFRADGLSVRYAYEPRPGKCIALNTALSEARGRAILFTDDDVVPPRNWIEGMCEPLLSGKAHAVAGGVRVAPHLERPWMVWLHRAWLASTDYLNAEDPEDLVGANMAVSREVLDKVPGFDPELGPGALGFGDESLFGLQLREAGYKITAAFDVVVEHHFDESRLLRANLLDIARKMGRTKAYLAHHWEHQTIPDPLRQQALWRLRLVKWRWQRGGEWARAEGMPEWEMAMLREYHFYRQYRVERKRPRNYERHGLVKLNFGQAAGARLPSGLPGAAAGGS